MKKNIKTEAVRRVARNHLFNQLDFPERIKDDLTEKFIVMCLEEEQRMEGEVKR